MIVEAVGTAVSTSGTNPEAKKRAKRLQEVMDAAVKQAFEEGVSVYDTKELLKRKFEAFEKFKNEE